MTTLQSPPPGLTRDPAWHEPEAVLARTRTLAAELAAGAAGTERARTVAPETVERLREAGLFSLTLPRVLGGSETDPHTVLSVIEEVSAADPSVGWALMIGQSSGFLGWADVSTGRQVVDVTPDPVIACALAPMGVGAVLPAEQVGDAGEPVYRLQGKWSINSGCRHADWFIAAFAMKQDGEDSPSWGEDFVRFAVLPADRVQVLDTWRVMGLRGSGSDDVVIADVDVPHSMTFSPFFEAAEHEGPLYKLSYFAFLMMMMGGFSSGLARRAIEEVSALAQEGAAVRIADPDTHVELWRHDNDRLAARLLLHDAAEAVWQEVRRDGAASAVTRARFAGAVQLSQRTAERVVDFAYRAAGPAALRAEHPLQRCWRDIHAAGAHIAFSLTAERRMARVVYEGDRSMQYMI
jgi:alkylation response protein AidB-like acyl-CoA dehydrogenase